MQEFENDRNLNIDLNEVNKFNKNAKHWWDKKGEYKILHEINPLRMSYIQMQLDNLKKATLSNKKVLDVGCGGGILTESLAKAGANVEGIDLAEEALSVAKLHLLESQLDISYHNTTIEEFAEKSLQSAAPDYDVITCLEMLEHVPNPESVVNACAQLLKPGGLIFFSTINRTPKSYTLAILGAEYILKLLPQGTHDYKKFIMPSELDKWARQSKLQLKHITGMHYNPVTKHFWLDKGVDVNYIACFQKI